LGKTRVVAFAWRATCLRTCANCLPGCHCTIKRTTEAIEASSTWTYDEATPVFVHTNTMASKVTDDLIILWKSRIASKMTETVSSAVDYVVGTDVKQEELPWIKKHLAPALHEDGMEVGFVRFNPDKAPDCDCSVEVCSHSKGLKMRVFLV
jgi:hypothetical protein